MNTALDQYEAYAGYPRPIRPYLLRADTNQILRAIFTKSGMYVLLDILSRANISDAGRPILLRVDRVAQRVGTSEKTVQRVLKVLREKGWLLASTTHDGRDRNGKFSHREFLVGDELRTMMGLPPYRRTNLASGNELSEETGQIKSVNQQKDVDNSTARSELSDGHIVNNLPKEDIKKASLENPENKNPRGGLPADLLPLRDELGIAHFAVAKLMKLAREQQKRLQDIWLAKKDAIYKSGVRQGKAFNYLKTLIFADIDYKAMANQQTRIQQLGDPVAQSDFKRFWYKRYAGANGVRVRVFDGIAEVSLSAFDIRIVPAADMASVYEAIEKGKLKEVLE